MARPAIRRRVIVAGVAGLAVVAAGTSAWALSGTSDSSYRYATAEHGSVAQTITTTGVLSPIHSADVDFQVAGTVSRVRVKQGQRVRAGEVLARLDRTDLRKTLTAAKSTLSTARATLTSDEASQSSSSDTVDSTSTATPTATSSSTSTGTSSTSGTDTKALKADQAALVAAQHRADADLMVAKTALAAEKTACESELGSSTTSTTAATADSGASACTSAAKALYADQTTVSKDQLAVQTAETALTAALNGSASTTARSGTETGSHAKRAANTSSAASTSSANTSSANTSSAASTSAANTSSGQSYPSTQSDESTSTTVTASQLASDAAAIDTDRAAVATAKESLQQAVIHSPISGRVVALTIHRGDTVTGSSSSTSPAVEIVGSRQSVATIGLTAAQVRTVTTGMKAYVTADGSSNVVGGVVTSVGIAAVESSTGDSTYPVVIALSKKATTLVSGADAAVTLDLAHASNVLVVPTSAVHRNGAKTYVQDVRNGKLVRILVKVGAVGASTTQITSGLTAGQRVVLADLNAKVPSSSSNLTSTGGNRFRTFSFGAGAGPTGGFAPGSQTGSFPGSSR